MHERFYAKVGAKGEWEMESGWMAKTVLFTVDEVVQFYKWKTIYGVESFLMMIQFEFRGDLNKVG